MANIINDTIVHWFCNNHSGFTLELGRYLGTLLLPTSDFDCLRLREMSKRITVTSFNDIPFSSDTIETVSYTWLSKAHLQTFSVDSIDGGMGEVSQIISGETSTAVVGSNNQPNGFSS